MSMGITSQPHETPLDGNHAQDIASSEVRPVQNRLTDMRPLGRPLGADSSMGKCEPKTSNWTFLTNHAHVLLCLAREHHETLREVAECVGITERAVQRIVADLEQGGIITRARDGRRNRYTVDINHPLRHDLEAHKTIGDLMKMVLKTEF